MDRPFVLGAITVFILAPLASLRSMGHLGVVNLVGLVSLVGFAGATCWIGLAAVTHGSAHVLPIGPDLEGLGPDTASRITSALAVVPILLTAVGSCTTTEWGWVGGGLYGSSPNDSGAIAYVIKPLQALTCKGVKGSCFRNSPEVHGAQFWFC